MNYSGFGWLGLQYLSVSKAGLDFYFIFLFFLGWGRGIPTNLTHRSGNSTIMQAHRKLTKNQNLLKVLLQSTICDVFGIKWAALRDSFILWNKTRLHEMHLHEIHRWRMNSCIHISCVLILCHSVTPTSPFFFFFFGWIHLTLLNCMII